MAEDDIQKYMADVKKYQGEAKRRKQAIRNQIDSGYSHLMGTPLDPQDHPVNNVSHPSGNRGRPDATLSAMPLSQPTTGSMGSEIDDY